MVAELVPQLRRYAYALVGDAERADDLLQETVLRAIAKEDRWQPGTNLRAWLFTVMHNIYVDDRRRFAARPPHLEIADHSLNLADPPGQGAALDLRLLEAALRRLPDEQREVVLLVGLQGFTYGEAAEVVGVPVGTVRSRLSRGREALRLITGYMEPEPGELTTPAGD